MINIHDDIWKGIGLNILYYRKKQGLSQARLAAISHISRNYIQRIETAKEKCSFDTLIDIANALNIPVQKLLELHQ